MKLQVIETGEIYTDSIGSTVKRRMWNFTLTEEEVITMVLNSFARKLGSYSMATVALTALLRSSDELWKENTTRLLSDGKVDEFLILALGERRRLGPQQPAEAKA